MKNKLLSFIIMFGLIIQAQGQMLEFKNSRKISQRGENLSRLEIHELMKDNPESLHLYQSGKTLRTVGDFTFFGGLIIAIGGVALNNLTDVGDKKHSINSYPWEGYYKGTFSEKKLYIIYSEFNCRRSNVGYYHSFKNIRKKKN